MRNAGPTADHAMFTTASTLVLDTKSKTGTVAARRASDPVSVSADGSTLSAPKLENSAVPVQKSNFVTETMALTVSAGPPGGNCDFPRKPPTLTKAPTQPDTSNSTNDASAKSPVKRWINVRLFPACAVASDGRSMSTGKIHGDFRVGFSSDNCQAYVLLPVAQRATIKFLSPRVLSVYFVARREAARKAGRKSLRPH